MREYDGEELNPLESSNLLVKHNDTKEGGEVGEGGGGVVEEGGEKGRKRGKERGRQREKTIWKK